MRTGDTWSERNRSRLRDAHQAHRRWYKTARWQKLRWTILVRDMFTCAMCNRIEVDTSQLVADHRQPHRGDERLFWDEANLQCICKTCHDSTKQRAEKGGALIGCDESGWPLDSEHPWRRRRG